jgi:hypothetical protein
LLDADTRDAAVEASPARPDLPFAPAIAAILAATLVSGSVQAILYVWIPPAGPSSSLEGRGRGSGDCRPPGGSFAGAFFLVPILRRLADVEVSSTRTRIDRVLTEAVAELRRLAQDVERSGERLDALEVVREQ